MFYTNINIMQLAALASLLLSCCSTSVSALQLKTQAQATAESKAAAEASAALHIKSLATTHMSS